jgi:hypothetical protein
MSPAGQRLVIDWLLAVRSRDLADETAELLPDVTALRIAFDRACQLAPNDQGLAEARAILDKLSRLGTEARSVYAHFVALVGPPADKPDNRPTVTPPPGTLKAIEADRVTPTETPIARSMTPVPKVSETRPRSDTSPSMPAWTEPPKSEDE